MNHFVTAALLRGTLANRLEFYFVTLYFEENHSTITIDRYGASKSIVLVICERCTLNHQDEVLSELLHQVLIF